RCIKRSGAIENVLLRPTGVARGRCSPSIKRSDAMQSLTPFSPSGALTPPHHLFPCQEQYSIVHTFFLEAPSFTAGWWLKRLDRRGVWRCWLRDHAPFLPAYRRTRSRAFVNPTEHHPVFVHWLAPLPAS